MVRSHSTVVSSAFLLSVSMFLSNVHDYIVRPSCNHFNDFPCGIINVRLQVPPCLLPADSLPAALQVPGAAFRWEGPGPWPSTLGPLPGLVATATVWPERAQRAALGASELRHMPTGSGQLSTLLKSIKKVPAAFCKTRLGPDLESLAGVSFPAKFKYLPGPGPVTTLRTSAPCPCSPRAWAPVLSPSLSVIAST